MRFDSCCGILSVSMNNDFNLGLFLIYRLQKMWRVTWANQDEKEDSSVLLTQLNPVTSDRSRVSFAESLNARKPWRSSRNPVESLRNKLRGVLTVIYPALTSIRAMCVLDQLWECVWRTETQMLHLYWDERSCDKRRNKVWKENVFQICQWAKRRRNIKLLNNKGRSNLLYCMTWCKC